ncbi:hypothetical protein FXN82_06950 [Citrobacter portucalensis]|nr:hypothetical protein FXN82_06950 [Citrobacter portucalensis]
MMVILFSSFAIVDPQRGGNNDITTGKDFNPQSVNFNLHCAILREKTALINVHLNLHHRIFRSTMLKKTKEHRQ